ncbi:aurka-b [Symbiodinium necroappetens]|uniref:Aurka-b protein n=1 Tax=Symbiodinium necroappetens TaxID=1628268 RepID=A0A812SB49_9DINO|nr:aurka-b [Symbiodinium necroappetens]
MEAERCKQLREMHALLAFACFLNGLTLVCMAILQLTEPELLNLGLILRRIFQPLLLIVLEALIATCAFHGRRCAAERLRLVQRWEFTHIQSVHQINTASVAMEKKFTADVEWYFLMHMTTSKFEQGQLKPLTPAPRDSTAPGEVPQTRPSMPFWNEETDKPEPTEIPAAEGHAQEEAFAGCFVLLQPGSGLEGFEEGDEVSQPRCVHFFHRSCLENWVQALSKEHVTSAKRKREQVLCPMRCDSAKVSTVSLQACKPVSAEPP